MNLIHWQNWLDDYATDPDCALYFMLNNQAKPSPVSLFYENGWVKVGFALYHQSPLSAQTSTGPWLIQANPTLRYSQLLPESLLTTDDWGYAYRSKQPFAEQLNFWRQRLFFEINGQLQVCRWMDPRVLSTLLPAFTPEDWREFAFPITSLILSPAGLVYQAPARRQTQPYQENYQLPARLYQVWQLTPKNLANLSHKMIDALWESDATETHRLQQQLGELAPFIQYWLKQQITEKQSDQMTVSHAKRYLQQLNLALNQNNTINDKETHHE